MADDGRLDAALHRLDAGLSPPMSPKRSDRCVFCPKTKREVVAMVEASTGARICDECIGLCNGLLKGSADG